MDVCEILFSALKLWVMGQSKQSVSLLSAIIRIVAGSRKLVMRPFLKSIDTTRRMTVSKTQCFPVMTFFQYCVSRLTQWAVKHLYNLYDRSGKSYVLTPPAANGSVTVTNRLTNI